VDDASDEDIRILYQTAWVTVLPSVHLDAWDNVALWPELMGLAALESMACGTPAAVSTAGALPEFVEDGKTGFVFRSLEHLAKICEHFATAPSQADLIGSNAALAVQEKFSLEVVGDALWNSYNELLT
jgi:glycosyltransferase involved in cell wall biosynthesis